MAYTDLTPEEQQAVQRALYSPPPAIFQTAQPQPAGVDPRTRAMAASGMLGSSGRFIEQIAREQERQQELARIADISRAAAAINPLDADYTKKVQALAMRDPQAFATGQVQQSLAIGEQQRREQAAQQKLMQDAMEEQQLAQANAALQTATPEQLAAFQASGSPLAYKLRDTAQAAQRSQSEAADFAMQLPEHLRTGLEAAPSYKVKAEVNKFRSSLPPALAKIGSLDAQREIVDLAKQWEEASKQDAEAIKGVSKRELADIPQRAPAIAADINALLGKTDGKEASEATIRALRSADKFFTSPERATSDYINSLLQQP
jgi:hypothetical protein